VPARLDRSPSSVVVRCSECPGYRDLANDPIEAGRLAARHDRREHGSQRAGDALTAAIRRRSRLQ
jgi:hypothetical protein